jgi:serine/threonine protein kinase
MDKGNQQDLKEYILSYDKLLGEGAFAKVFFGIKKETQESVAIKVINKKKLSGHTALLTALNREMDTLRKIKGDNVVQLRAIQEIDTNIFMVMDYCSGPDIATKLERAGTISQEQAVKYLKEFMRGYKILHQFKIVHRDIKPANLLLHNDVLKICDFGFSKYVPAENLTQTSRVGSPLYMSPQILNGMTQYTDKCDVWSTGITFYEMLFGDAPFPARTEKDLKNMHADLKIRPFKFPHRETNLTFNPHVGDLLNKMLKYEEKDRISWEEIFNHPLIVGEVEKARPKIKILSTGNGNGDKPKLEQVPQKLLEDSIVVIPPQQQQQPKITLLSTENPKINSSGPTATKKSGIKIISAETLTQSQVQDFIDTKFKEEQQKKAFTLNTNKIQSHIELLQFYVNLMLDSQNVFEAWQMNKDFNFYKILHVACNLGTTERDLLKKLLLEGVNTLGLEQWEAFKVSTIYLERQSAMQNELEVLCTFGLNDCVVTRNALYKELSLNMNILPMEEQEHMKDILRFMQVKVKDPSNRTNRKMLGVIESLCQIKNKDCLKQSFDSTKYFEGQINTAIGTYFNKIVSLLDQFGMESAN